SLGSEPAAKALGAIGIGATAVSDGAKIGETYNYAKEHPDDYKGQAGQAGSAIVDILWDAGLSALGVLGATVPYLLSGGGAGQIGGACGFTPNTSTAPSAPTSPTTTGPNNATNPAFGATNPQPPLTTIPQPVPTPSGGPTPTPTNGGYGSYIVISGVCYGQ